MNLVNGTQVARLASVTKAAVSLAKKRGRLPVDPSNLFDLDSRAVQNWIRDRSGQRRAGRPCSRSERNPPPQGPGP